MQMQRVFVYGTLRRHELNHHLLRNATYAGIYRTTAEYTLWDLGWYPAAVQPGNTALIGEVYTVCAAQLAALDALEAYPYEYTRRMIATSYGNAWIYLYQRALPPKAARIPSGDWRKRRGRIRPLGLSDWPNAHIACYEPV